MKKGLVKEKIPSGDTGLILRIVDPEQKSMPPFKPGQYTALSLSERNANETRAYSICSLPEDDFWEFLITVVESGLVSKQLAGLEVGMSVYYKDIPKGKMTLDRVGDQENIIFVATGSGVGPFKPMVNALVALNNHKILLLQGARKKSELHYFSFFSEICHSNTNFTYMPYVSREKVTEPTLREGRVTDFFRDFNFSSDKTIAFVCGNPQMVDDVCNLLIPHGFSVGKNIITESYW
ncbi:MAG: FAD-binding oxidoreductase [Deltaproteobacteria bacterium]|nr:FAD-binding oxidoreductase [Deltaproteobacteria bacterium]MCX7952861.1 FAD-binding oxidoreductase [Deltaproteobacteria bacterium]